MNSFGVLQRRSLALNEGDSSQKVQAKLPGCDSILG